ncbi:hypothetical protein, partial [Propionibacterium australiense]|uniref:hypothetical protein n=1 Tax=Propionibacterium australiense TaxID=119981 RepID=UPI001C7D4FF8
TDASNTSAAPPSASATSPTTSPEASSKPADSDNTYTLDCEEPLGANARGNLNASVGSYFEGIHRGDLDAGVSTVSNLASLIKSIDSCAGIVAELAGAFTN